MIFEHMKTDTGNLFYCLKADEDTIGEIVAWLEQHVSIQKVTQGERIRIYMHCYENDTQDVLVWARYNQCLVEITNPYRNLAMLFKLTFV